MEPTITVGESVLKGNSPFPATVRREEIHLLTHSQTSGKCNTRQSKTANKLLTSPAESGTRVASRNLHNAVICLRILVWQWHGRDSPRDTKVIVAPQFFLSCYFKVKLLILTLTLKYNYCIMPL